MYENINKDIDNQVQVPTMSPYGSLPLPALAPYLRGNIEQEQEQEQEQEDSLNLHGEVSLAPLSQERGQLVVEPLRLADAGGHLGLGVGVQVTAGPA